VSEWKRFRDEAEFDVWVERALERADPFMAWLGALFALLVGFELAAAVGPTTARWLDVTGLAIWAIFGAEFAAQLWLAPERLRFLRHRWWQVLLLAVPVLRVFRFVRLLRLGRALPVSRVLSSSYRVAGSAKLILRSRLGYLAGLSGLLAVAAAELAYLFERDVEDGAFASFGDALLWSFAAVIGMQADPVPKSVGARLTMVACFAVGLVLVASLAGVFGAFLLGELDERRAGERDMSVS